MSDGHSGLKRWLGELRRRKVIRVAVTYLIAGWVLIQIAETTFAPLGLPDWTIKLVIVLIVLGFPLACALAWAFDVTPKGVIRADSTQRREEPAEAARVAPADTLPAQPSAVASAPEVGVGSSENPAGTSRAAQSVAILPFADMSAERDQGYFCDGIAEEIINALTCVRGLNIASRTSSFQFKDRSVGVKEIGEALQVGSVLEGSIRKSGNRVRITAQLVNTTDGYHLFSKSFDRQLEDVFAIQTEIAQEMVNALQVSLSSGEAELLERGGTRNPEAYDLYLRGQALLRDGTDSTLAMAGESFREAIKRDPSFAQAHAGLASAISVRGLWQLDVTPDDYERAFAAVKRALEIEPLMPEAIVARACLLGFQQQRLEEASQTFEQALRLNPNAYYAHYVYARHLFSIGNPEKSIEHYKAAIRLAPLEYAPRSMLVIALEKLGRNQEALQEGQRALQAIESHLQTHPNDGRALHLAAVHAAKHGDAKRVHEFAEQAIRARPGEFATLYNLACAFASIGNKERALELLERATEQGHGNRAWMEQDPDLDSLREDPRFTQLIDRIKPGSGASVT
jgi:TolB-like protein/Tfp pilus assembly protein PilF